jgi:hypothetical protein
MADVEQGPIPPKTVTKIEAVTYSVPQVDAQISAGHVYDHVYINVHGGRQFSIDTELVVGPAPDKFPDVIEDEEESQERDEEGEETA